MAHKSGQNCIDHGINHFLARITRKSVLCISSIALDFGFIPLLLVSFAKALHVAVALSNIKELENLHI